MGETVALPNTWTHADLVRLAAKWLAKSCPVVITEMASTAWEEPDAIGWCVRGSILVECKVSRADLRADRNKPHRSGGVADGRAWVGMGDERYVLLPEELLTGCAEHIPKGWGLLRVNGDGKIRRMWESKRHEPDLRAERSMLMSAIRRLGIACDGGISVKVYSNQTKCRATLTVGEEEEVAGG